MRYLPHLLLVLLAALVLAAPASAYHRGPAHQIDRTLTIANCVPSPRGDHAQVGQWLRTAARRWSRSPAINVVLVRCTVIADVRFYSENYGLADLDGWPLDARTSIPFNRSGHFGFGVTRLNTYYAAPGDFRVAVVCQEIGRALGLKPSRRSRSCMRRCIDCLYPARPGPHDFSQLNSIYRHTRRGSG